MRIKLLKVYLCLLLCLTFCGLSAAPAVKPADIVSWKLVKTYTLPQLDTLYQENEIKSAFTPELLKKIGKPQNAVNAYLIEYLTRNYNEKLVKVSGLLLVPQPLTVAYPFLAYQHGTIIQKKGAPSYIGNCPEAQVMAMVFAAHGYVVGMPDYIGLGRSTLMHPYFHTPTEAGTSLDMLVASQFLCKKLGVKLNSRLFLSGYSQGGQVTLALQQLLEKGYAWEFQLTASAPGAAPADLTAWWDHTVAHPYPLANPVMSYLTVAYHNIYGHPSSYKNAFLPPYDQKAPKLVSGNINAMVGNPFPATPQKLFTAQFLNDAAQGSFGKRMKENSLKPWAPISPTCFYYSRGDEVVPAFMVEKYYRQCLKMGGDARLKACPEKLHHVEAYIPIMVMVREWFDGLK